MDRVGTLLLCTGTSLMTYIVSRWAEQSIISNLYFIRLCSALISHKRDITMDDVMGSIRRSFTNSASTEVCGAHCKQVVKQSLRCHLA